MNKKNLGCLSPLAFGTALITFLVIASFYLLNGPRMFSPGELNAKSGEKLGNVNSHADIGNQCNQCHTPFWSSKTMSDNCLVCHQIIQEELVNPDSFHVFFLNEGFTKCQECHPEHLGKEAQLTIIDQNTFPHQATGFYLSTHTQNIDGIAFYCSDCHPNDNFTFNLDPCIECHQEIDLVYTITHIETFGEKCLNCHNGLDRFSDFDHDQVQFKLDNSHKDIKCIKCHQQQTTLAELQNTANLCVDCHKQDDPHNNWFGEDCEKCHQTTSWEETIFDHSTGTGFVLVAAHLEVKCQDCHLNGYENTPTECISCHEKDDIHLGKYGLDCAACHQADLWQNAYFDHNQSRFILDGAHTDLECQSCHLNGIYSGTPIECAGCHQDPEFHLNMFTNQTCNTCHHTAAWKPAQYTGPHNFPYNHGEKNNFCMDCHQPNLTVWTCYPCHNQNEMIREHREEGISELSNCLRCHPTGQENEAEGIENNENHDGEDDD